jgi:CDP-2,3-bis-(O-geranylgeranyl)-sn-glycerol synthase
MTAHSARQARIPLGLILLVGLSLALLREAPAIAGSFLGARGIAARAYLVLLAAHVAHQRLLRRPLRLRRLLLMPAIPVILILVVAFLFGSLLALTSLRQVEIATVALILCTFNLGAVLFAGTTPLDQGRTLRDGRRLLGAGKTVCGAAGGLLVAVAAGCAAGVYFPFALLVATGALLGDLVGSFVKRRLGWARGEPVLFLDQLDGLLPFILVDLLWRPLGLAPLALLALGASIFTIQLSGNYILCRLGKKVVPW